MNTLDLHVENQINASRRDHEAKAMQHRLVREALTGRAPRVVNVTFHKPLLASIGKRLVVLGTTLQRRYASAHDYDYSRQTATLPRITA